MTKKELPEWATELDEEILRLLNSEMTLTPTVIAENIDRSRGAVTRRLNTLEAGGLVKKMFEGGWEMFKLSEKDQKKAAKEDYERRKQIKERTGLSEREYLKEVQEEYEQLRSEESESSEDRLSQAFEIVDNRYKEERE